jgi:hypothetical protein
MIIDDPATLTDVTAAFDAYEAALMTNDIAVLDGLFWESPKALRYGVGETLYGTAEIQAFRQARSGGSPPRRILRKTITTFGTDFATANIEFMREDGGPIGRQSQCWVRLADGWRIAAAHVSLQREFS